MSPVLLPEVPDDGSLRLQVVADARLYVRLMVGRYAGCTAFRTHEGRVEVGTLMHPTQRGGSRWGVHVKRNGLVMWWPLDGTVWVNT